ncbi:MAG: hypothetical protein KF894_09075 [Labilithrix sp.]|nr:hypothetical protein [Labilithrix sp.]
MDDARKGEGSRDAGESRGAPSSSRDLLDLVRSAEDDARLALRKRTPAIALAPSGAPSDRRSAVEEEFVDVGDDAVDAPPSMPPLRAPTPPAAFVAGGGPSSAAAARGAAGAPRGWSPLVGILVVLTLAVGALALIAR